jgi:hypothetical protein
MSAASGGGSGGESSPGRIAIAAIAATATAPIRSAASRLIRFPFTLHRSPVEARKPPSPGTAWL